MLKATENKHKTQKLCFIINVKAADNLAKLNKSESQRCDENKT